MEKVSYTTGELWEAYREFCAKAHKTQDMDSTSAPDFIAWLDAKI